MARKEVAIASGQHTGCFIGCNYAESDRTLARMTHMLTSSSYSANQDDNYSGGSHLFQW